MGILKRTILAGSAAIGLAGGANGENLEPGDAVIQTSDGVYEIISCSGPVIYPICNQNGTDELFSVHKDDK